MSYITCWHGWGGADPCPQCGFVSLHAAEMSLGDGARRKG